VFSVGPHLEVKRSNIPSAPLNTAPEVPKLAPRADHLRLFASRREIYRASLVPAPEESTTFVGQSCDCLAAIQFFREYSVYFPLLILREQMMQKILTPFTERQRRWNRKNWCANRLRFLRKATLHEPRLLEKLLSLTPITQMLFDAKEARLTVSNTLYLLEIIIQQLLVIETFLNWSSQRRTCHCAFGLF
jgi:hypothetical protein